MRSVYSGTDDDGNSFSQIFFASGGMGASPVADGHSCTAFNNSGSGSIEAFELGLVIWKKEFDPIRWRWRVYGRARSGGRDRNFVGEGNCVFR